MIVQSLIVVILLNSSRNLLDSIIFSDSVVLNIGSTDFTFSIFVYNVGKLIIPVIINVRITKKNL